MQNTHAQSLKAFDQRIARLLLLRGAVQWITLWLFVWGAMVLAARVAGVKNTEWLALGLLGIVPLLFFAGWRARRQRPEFSKIRASYDRLNECGGVIMAEEIADTRDWQAALSRAGIPRLRWRSGRAMLWLIVAGLFAGTALLLPERFTHLAGNKSLEVGQLVEQLQTEVQALQEEKILDEKKAEDVKQQLAQIEKDASGLDPNKTWEALDHIKEANAETAHQAAEEALDKLSKLSQAELLASAMEQAAQNGMNAETATQAAQTLAGMIKAAKLEDGLLKGAIPPELLSDLSGLDPEHMKKLMEALAANKDGLNSAMGKLAALKMIDPATLAKCNGAGQGGNPGALADFLSSCTNGAESAEQMMYYCRGGVSRGRGDALMTWKDESSDDGAKFKEEILPPSTHLSDAKFVGVSSSAPELSGNDVQAVHGALDNAAASGGSAHAQVILPEHRQAVQNFFKRDE